MKNNRSVRTALKRLIRKYDKQPTADLLGISVRYIDMLLKDKKPSSKIYDRIKDQVERSF